MGKTLSNVFHGHCNLMRCYVIILFVFKIGTWHNYMMLKREKGEKLIGEATLRYLEPFHVVQFSSSDRKWILIDDTRFPRHFIILISFFFFLSCTFNATRLHVIDTAMRKTSVIPIDGRLTFISNGQNWII